MKSIGTGAGREDRRPAKDTKRGLRRAGPRFGLSKGRRFAQEEGNG